MNIVLLYVSSDMLPSFFILHGLDFDLVFRYGVCDGKMMRMFGGMVCEGFIVGYEYGPGPGPGRCRELNCGLIDRLCGAKSVVMCGLEYSDVCRVMKRGVNVKICVFKWIKIDNFDFLAEFKKIESIIFHGCMWCGNSCSFLEKCVNLKKLEFTCGISNVDGVTLSRIVNLRELKVGRLSCILYCRKLRKIRIMADIYYKFDCGALYGCVSLRKIKLVGIKLQSNIDFSRFRKLRMIVFRGCFGLSELVLGNLGRCRELKCVKIVECNGSVDDEWIVDLRKMCSVRVC